MLTSSLMRWMQQRCSVTPGLAFKPMLAKVGCGIGDAVAKLVKQKKGSKLTVEKAGGADEHVALLCEYKYDGVRSQIHILKHEEEAACSRCEREGGIETERHTYEEKAASSRRQSVAGMREREA